MPHTITDLLAKLRESYEVETDLVNHYLDSARAFAASRVEATLQHKVSADEAASDGLRLALRYIRNKRGDAHMDRSQFKALLLAIVEKKVQDQRKRQTRKKRDVRREVPSDAVGLTAQQLAAIDRAVAKESGEKVAALLLAEKDEVARVVNLLAHLGGFSAASIQKILMDAGYPERAVSTISYRISACEKRMKSELAKDLDR